MLLENLGLYLDGVRAFAPGYPDHAIEEGPDGMGVLPGQPRAFGAVHEASRDGDGIVEQELPDPDRLAVAFQQQAKRSPALATLELSPGVVLQDVPAAG